MAEGKTQEVVKTARTAVLMNDIDLTGFDLGSYTRFNAWTISFDGQGHTISGFSDDAYGLFGANMNYGKDQNTGENKPTIIKNLHLNVNVKRVEETTRATNYGLLANKIQLLCRQLLFRSRTALSAVLWRLTYGRPRRQPTLTQRWFAQVRTGKTV